MMGKIRGYTEEERKEIKKTVSATGLKQIRPNMMKRFSIRR